ncbi:scarecrow-like protein 14 [Tripterygium wilfordii]|uniref:Scarecrow-like protein 14 n=1 Tax=Tripterygium wilfordii TaxID=458696 RepID=A0A7J7DYI7_TRIWF|nr:scarecrow-like protein 33 [Tripterygium wilfordii]XP_038722453.1 scarecrow-like protein 33 [Tripterygium wilfordii]KAF5751438.1 scarecrow-like protein 14 [Tripterygium wilfordii]
MDSGFNGFPNSINGFKFTNGDMGSPDSDRYSNLVNGFSLNYLPSLDHKFIYVPMISPDSNPVPSLSMEGESSSDDGDFSETVFKYISQMLMEEDMEDKPPMFHDPIALQAAEECLYDVLVDKHPHSQDKSFFDNKQIAESPYAGLYNSSSDYSSNTNYSSSTGDLVYHRWNGDFSGVSEPSLLQKPLLPSEYVPQSAAMSNPQPGVNSSSRLSSNGDGLVCCSTNLPLVPNLFGEDESVLQFKRGIEEASKFLPRGNKLVIDMENPKSRENAQNTLIKVERDDTEHSPNGFIGKKSHEREGEDFEGIISYKQSAASLDEGELIEMFDKVLLGVCERKEPSVCVHDEVSQKGESKNLQQNGRTNGSTGVKTKAKKQGKKKEVVDLRALLILCAQAVSANDRRTAGELLKQIRQHSSPFGDGSQRLAHCFANGLEARLDGIGTQMYTALSSKRMPASDMLNAYKHYISVCPFKKIAIIFANHTFIKLAEKANTLHIIDFGIFCGFQWPPLIYRLSNRPGGPPKLRITGIDLPQPGFRPAERVQETGRRLAKYCEHFKVPFEYNAIAQKWETIRVNDLKIRSGEVLAVNCLFKFRTLLDETVIVNSPRNAVLNLIRKINPDMYIQAIVNGCYNAPFFVTRFREALFHFSSLFDMLDRVSIPKDNQMRLMFEKEFYGKEVMNVVACEGMERVERPETYKQWQVRNLRAGFKPLPLQSYLKNKLRGKLGEGGYHKDFMVDEDGHWVLQGWKGRIICASSAWVPA